MVSKFRVIVLTMVCLLICLGFVSADNEAGNQSANSCENCSSLKAGNMALLNMIQMSTGPILSAGTNEKIEGGWLFNYYDDGYDDYGDGGYDDYGDDGYDPYDTGYDPYDTGYDPYDTGYDPYDTGYDPYDTGYDPYDTGYDPYDTGFDDYDPYHTGIITGTTTSGIPHGVVSPPVSPVTGAQMVPVGNYPSPMDAIQNVINQHQPVVYTPPSFPIDPTPVLCDCSGWGAEKCGGYYCYTPGGKRCTFGKSTATCRKICCGAFDWTPVYSEVCHGNCA